MPPTAGIRRIVVALDMSPHSLAALSAAADLAAYLNIELVGVFVEDANWLRHGDLPHACVVARYSAARVTISHDDIRRQLAAQAHAAAAALARLAEARHVRWSFSIARGVPPEALSASAHTDDVVSMGRAGWPAPGRRGVGSVTRRFVAEGPGSVLILAAGQHLRPPVILWADDTAAAGRAAGLAAAIAAKLDSPLQVLLSSASAAVTRQAEHDLRAALGADSPPVTFQPVPMATAPDLVEALGAAHPGVLVAPRGLVTQVAGGLNALLDRARCPVLVTR